ncbi:MAG: DedA family protein [Alphaproteobacteria bacterium]|nr:MAG: DedA family protein [Alphaproteobacteria bacterium]
MDYRRKLAAYASAPDAQWRLFGISAMEAVFAPMPSDFLLIPMAMLTPERAFRYALVASLGSALGAIVLYMLGFMLFQVVASAVVLPVWLLAIITVFKSYAGVFVFPAGFSTVPFNVVSLLSGVAQVNILLFIAITVLVRTIRYNIIALLIWRGGTRYQEWLERNFYGFMLVMTLGLLVVSLISVLFFETA